MPVLMAIATIIQLWCAYHAFSAGRGLGWIVFILAVPIVGWMTYLISAVVERMKLTATLEKNAADVFSGADRSIDLGKLRDEVEACDTIYNREKLAEGLLRHEEFESAIEQYETCLSMGPGSYPKILLELSLAQFLSEKYAQARANLERMAHESPTHEPPRRDLLLARTLEQLGDLEGALLLFEKLSDWPGEEVECRKALLLKKMGRVEEAKRIFEGVLKREKRFTDMERASEKRWIMLAKKHLSAV